MYTEICKICQVKITGSTNWGTKRKLGTHLKHNHLITPIEYILKFEYAGKWPECLCGCKHKVRYGKWQFGKYFTDHKNKCKVSINVREKISNTLFPFFSAKKHKSLTNFVEKILIEFSNIIGIIRFDTDINKAVTGRSKVIWEEAINRGIKVDQLVVFGKYIDNYRAKINGKTIFFQSIPIPPWFNTNGYDWIDDKFVLAEKLHKAGIPSPLTKIISSFKKTEVVFENLKKPIIIKPRLGSRGRHTTTNINTLEDFKKAYLLAKKISPSVIAQEHLFGSVYRATVVNDVLVGFFRADPANITGDGIKNIKELILEKNKNRSEKMSDILINEEVLNFIKRQNYTLESVLSKDITINLSAKTGRFYGGYTKEMLPEVHSKIYSLFEKASKYISVPVAGFDFIIEDPTKDPDGQRCGIIECNSLPFIDLHYFALEGKPVNIASYIWDLWDTKK